MDTRTTEGFFDELEKISSVKLAIDGQYGNESGIPDNLITPERFKRFLGAAIPGALGAGVGYGTARFVGRPIEEKLVSLGLKHGPAKVLRYALPTAAGLGAALSLSRANLRNKLFEAVRGEDTKRNIDTEQQPDQLG